MAWPEIQAQKYIYFDENGNKINKSKFLKNWRDKDLLLSRWDSLGNDGKRYVRLKKDLYLKAKSDYNYINKELEKLTNKSIPENTILLLNFNFKDDLCTSRWDNNWTKNDIQIRKHFLDPIKATIEKDSIIYLVLFEKGMIVKNNTKRKNEYFFLDENSFFRKNIFKNPTLCGSFALIKPNGQTLIRNGEYRADDMVQHLIPENWNLFFGAED